MTHSALIRLKVLKDEIKKPYFIALKEFLWKEGVHGPDDSANNLKIYPARKFMLSLSVHFVGSSRCRGSAEYLFMVKLYSSGQSQSRYDWPRPIPRTRSSTRYATRRSLLVFPTPPVVGLLTHAPVFPATGLCFSVPPGVPAPPSLRNVPCLSPFLFTNPPSHVSCQS